MIHFVSDAPRCRPCPRCQRLILTGLGEGIPYRVDPTPLTAHAELRARLAGRESWYVVAGQLAARTASRIAGVKPWQQRPIVFADHACAVVCAPGDVDPSFLPVIARLLATGSADRTGWNPWEDSETHSVTLLNYHLGARVITDDRPPF